MRTNLYLIETANKYGIPLVAVENKDTLNRTHLQNNGGYIINLENEKDLKGNYNFGTHWVAVYVENNKAIFFDPFGLIPTLEIQNFLCPLGKAIYYNKKEIQNVHSGLCGDYCIYFLKFMHDNRRRIPDPENRLRQFQSLFSDDTTQNGKILRGLWSPAKEASR